MLPGGCASESKRRRRSPPPPVPTEYRSVMSYVRGAGSTGSTESDFRDSPCTTGAKRVAIDGAGMERGSIWIASLQDMNTGRYPPNARAFVHIASTPATAADAAADAAATPKFECSCDVWADERAGLQHYGVYLDDTPAAADVFAARIDSICAFMHTVLLSECDVVVHCDAGLSRSPAVAVAYLILYAGRTYEEAYAIVHAAQPNMCINIGFCSVLMHLLKRAAEKKP